MAEVVEFRVPTGSAQTLLVWGLEPEPGLEHSLFSAFSKFGPLYSVRAHRNAAVAGPGYYAVIKFYSAGDASRAQEACNGQRLFQKSPLKLQNVSGFDGENEELGKTLQKRSIKYLCAVEVTLPNHGVCTRGVALGEADIENGEDPLEFVTASRRVQKLAVGKALSSAFQKILLVVLENGKVAVEYSSTQEELTDSFTEEELKGLVQVSELSLEQFDLEEEEVVLSDLSFDYELPSREMPSN
ncbi:RAD52 motif-containing protein 1 isoform X5 [Phalacrocorax aristotelis]|uniref:RAD52 motif-containing protein 1 isoform X5 n=1 Tax=Phalacrocorax aristotelis TaxID=126867 RepID=UPI003F4C697A